MCKTLSFPVHFLCLGTRVWLSPDVSVTKEIISGTVQHCTVKTPSRLMLCLLLPVFLPRRIILQKTE